MVKAKELPCWFEVSSPLPPTFFFFFCGDSTQQKAQKESKRLILRQQNWVIGVKSHLGLVNNYTKKQQCKSKPQICVSMWERETWK